MSKKLASAIAAMLLLTASNLFPQKVSLPHPPPEFFAELAETHIPPGEVGCCHKLRKMLVDSVMISPYLAVKLFREGKILIGDARTTGEIQGGHIFGAIPLPHEKLDFMKLKPINKPIALY